MQPPFPGMDPWLENPVLWADVHASLIVVMSELLTAKLRPRYFVGVERRAYILKEDDPAQRQIVPDLTVSRESSTKPASITQARGSSSVVLMVMDEIEVKESRLVIRTVGGEREAVAVIELLSPANKSQGSHGREEYLSKRREILHSRVHLVEIDLLREGCRIPSAQPLPAGDYYVHVSRAAMRPRGQIFAFGVRDPLPEVPIPLAGSDPEVGLDLGRAFRETYERRGYDIVVDYSRPPVPALSPADQTWAEGILRQAR